jgi:hypothetical protein
MILDKFPENYQFSEEDKAKLLRAYAHLDAYIARQKLTPEDAPKNQQKRSKKKDGNQQTGTDGTES